MFSKQHFRTLSCAGSRTSFKNDDGLSLPMRIGRGVCMRALPPLRVEGGCAAGHPAHWDPPEEQHTLILSVSTIPREPSRPFAQSLL